MNQAITDWIRTLNKSNSLIQVRRSPRLRRKKKFRFKERTLKRHVWDASDNILNLGKIMQQFEHTEITGQENQKIFLGCSDFDDLIISEILKRRVDAKQKTVHRETTVLCNREHWATWAEEYFKNDLYIQPTSSSGIVIEHGTNNYVRFDVNSNTTSVRAYGDEVFCEAVILLVENTFDIVTSHIEWVYNGDGSSVNVPLNRDRLPVAEMYPFLKGESLGNYYDRYMESSANILLLIGPPGTGKTTFIRGLLAHTNSSAIVSYDSAILDKDGFFARFIEDDASVMVLEDSDAFLKPRTDGNTMMHRFLNVGDGLVTTKGKKMIFSTNLPSIRDIDSALTRPGRCFDILTFAPLSQDEAKVLAGKLGATIGEQSSWSVAEIFNKQQNKPEERKVGFI